MRRLPSSWSASLLASLGYRRTKKKRSDQRHHRSRMEQLERREMLASDTYLVTTLADQIDGVETDGLSLREAISKATTDGDVIRFDPSLFALESGTILLGDADGDGAIGAGETPTQLSISSTVSIIGPGQELLTVSGGDATRVFDVKSGAVATLSDFTIAKGRVAGATNQNDGAGIHSAGDLTLSRMTLRDNHAADSGAMGGGVFAYAGGLYVEDTTFTRNSSRNGGGAAIWGYNSSGAEISGSTFYLNESDYGGGGGLTIQGNAPGGASIRVVNSTFSANDADYYGGGVLLAHNSTAEIVNTTIVENTATNVAKAGVALIGGSSAANLSNTVVADNYWGSQIRNGVDSTPSNFVQVVGEAYQDPMLGPLTDNGGPTLTHAILSGSPLIDAGDDAHAAGFDNDQRAGGGGASQRRVGTVDIGAFEYGAVAIESTRFLSIESLTFPAADDLITFYEEESWIAGNARGETVATYRGDGPEGFGVYLRSVNTTLGYPGTPRLVDLGQVGLVPSQPRVAIDGDGRYGVLWLTEADATPGLKNVWLRRYRSDGAPIDDLPVQVATDVADSVSFAANESGRLVVSWKADDGGFYFRRYTTSGVSLDAAPRLATASAGDLSTSGRNLAVSPDGGFVAQWESGDQIVAQ
ncbi:MAG: right-handed parallel beta-helix repeat-containing protein, partial [Planctomycetota bacterium]